MRSDTNPPHRSMHKGRLEAFSDGVIAIILTIMVLDLKVPREHTLEGLAQGWPVFGAYALSYWNVFLIWLSHHRAVSQLDEVDTPLLMANGLLLFTVSFIPFVTAFASESHWTDPVPIALYGAWMAVVSLAFLHLRRAAARASRTDAQRALHRTEASVSAVLAVTFVLGATTAWLAPRWALLVYALVPLARRLRHNGHLLP